MGISSIKTLVAPPLPLRDRWILIALIAANILLFVAECVWPDFKESMMLHSPAIPTPPLATALLNWRALASYSFVHSGAGHLFCNMIFLWIVGSRIAMLNGLRGMLWLYLGGTWAGALGFLFVGAFFPTGSWHSLCGASAAVLSLCGAVLACRPSRAMRITAWTAVGISILGNPSGAALATHICGFASGWIFERIRIFHDD